MCHKHDTVLNSLELDPASNGIKSQYAIYQFILTFICKCSLVDDQYLIETCLDFKKIRSSDKN
jgi:hypothetical protein